MCTCDNANMRQETWLIIILHSILVFQSHATDEKDEEFVQKQNYIRTDIINVLK